MSDIQDNASAKSTGKSQFSLSAYLPQGIDPRNCAFKRFHIARSILFSPSQAFDFFSTHVLDIARLFSLRSFYVTLQFFCLMARSPIKQHERAPAQGNELNRLTLERTERSHIGHKRKLRGGR